MLVIIGLKKIYYNINMLKSISAPANLNKMSELNLKENHYSFNSFEKLELKSQQKLLSFGEYCNKSKYNRKNRIKIIKYFYKNIMKSRL